MWAYVIRRSLYTIPIIFGVLVVTFVLFRLIPGNIASMVAGRGASAETIEQIREEMGLNKPLFFNIEAASEGAWYGVFDSQFFNYLIETITFQFGRSRITHREVTDILLNRAIPSLSLTLPIFLGLLVSGLLIALFVALMRGTSWDMGIVSLCVAGMSFPMLSMILLGQYFLAYKLGWFPVFGYAPWPKAIVYLALPVLLGIVSGLGANVRFYRTVVLDDIESDYIRTARAKGANTRRVLLKHLLRNLMVPVLTNVLLVIPFLFLGSLLLEKFFGIPGLGYLMINAITRRDFVVVNALTYIIALLFVIFNLLTDVAYALADPRISLQ